MTERAMTLLAIMVGYAVGRVALWALSLVVNNPADLYEPMGYGFWTPLFGALGGYWVASEPLVKD